MIHRLEEPAIPKGKEEGGTDLIGKREKHCP